MSSNFSVDPAMAMKSAQDQDMVRRKMEIDALRERITPGQDQKAKLRESCEGFESVFIQKLWEQMRNTVPKDGYLHSKQEAMYQSMYDAEFSKKMASAGGIGLADMLYDQLSQSLGESSRTTSPSINLRLPVVPSSSSPSNLKFTHGEANTELKRGNAPTTNVRPLYEDFDENSDLRSFSLPGKDNLAGKAGQEVDLSRHTPFSMPQDNAEANNVVYQDNVGNLTHTSMDFEALSHELLQQELMEGSLLNSSPNLSQQNNSSQTESSNMQATVARPVSTYAQEFNRRHAATATLSPEETLLLQEALMENFTITERLSSTSSNTNPLSNVNEKRTQG